MSSSSTSTISTNSSAANLSGKSLSESSYSSASSSHDKSLSRSDSRSTVSSLTDLGPRNGIATKWLPLRQNCVKKIAVELLKDEHETVRDIIFPYLFDRVKEEDERPKQLYSKLEQMREFMKTTATEQYGKVVAVRAKGIGATKLQGSSVSAQSTGEVIEFIKSKYTDYRDFITHAARVLYIPLHYDQDEWISKARSKYEDKFSVKLLGRDQVGAHPFDYEVTRYMKDLIMKQVRYHLLNKFGRSLLLKNPIKKPKKKTNDRAFDDSARNEKNTISPTIKKKILEDWQVEILKVKCDGNWKDLTFYIVDDSQLNTLSDMEPRLDQIDVVSDEMEKFVMEMKKKGANLEHVLSNVNSFWNKEVTVSLNEHKYG